MKKLGKKCKKYKCIIYDLLIIYGGSVVGRQKNE